MRATDFSGSKPASAHPGGRCLQLKEGMMVEGGGKKAGAYVLDPQVHIGHLHLKVSNLDRALAFYCGVLGFDLTQRYGADAAFISAGGYHHHIGLNTWESLGGPAPPSGTTGLYHTAIVYPTRASLAEASILMRAQVKTKSKIKP